MVKSEWLPTMPLHVETWIADPRIRELSKVQRIELLEALLCNWMANGESRKRIKKSIKEAYEFYAPLYEEERKRCVAAYERKSNKWTAYSRELSDPRWAEVRNIILERDGNACTGCGAIHRLQVHHLRYKRGEKAWETPHAFLTTLCKSCHEDAHGRSFA